MSTLSGSVAETRKKQNKRDEVRVTCSPLPLLYGALGYIRHAWSERKDASVEGRIHVYELPMSDTPTNSPERVDVSSTSAIRRRVPVRLPTRTDGPYVQAIRKKIEGELAQRTARPELFEKCACAPCRAPRQVWAEEWYRSKKEVPAWWGERVVGDAEDENGDGDEDEWVE